MGGATGWHGPVRFPVGPSFSSLEPLPQPLPSRSALCPAFIAHHETTTLLQPPTFQCATTSAPLHTHSLPLAATAPSCEQGRVRKFAHLNLSRTQGKQHFSNSVKIGKTPKHAKSLRKQHFVF